jgi:hypothetical protein
MPASCADLSLKGIKAVTLQISGQSITTLCDYEAPDGPWALLYNSVGSTAGTTLPFWNIPYADRLKVKGTADLAQNFYAGGLYLVGKTYRDDVEDTGGKKATVLEATAAGFDATTMRFVSPARVSGSEGLYAAQFATGWSSPDYDADTYSANCATQYGNVTQHYSACWVYNLGADADPGNVEDGGWGPHFGASFAAEAGFQLDGSGYVRVGRISRWTR